MKTIFRSLGLWEFVSIGFDNLESTEHLSAAQKNTLKENQEKDADVLSKIQSRISDSIFPRIMRASVSKEAWDILQQEFQGNDKVRAVKLQSLRRDFENIKMKENESMNEFYSRFIELVNQMKSCGDDIPDKKQVEKILKSFPDKFIPIIYVIKETKDLSTLSIQNLMGSLKSYEQRVKGTSESSVEGVFQSKVNINSKTSWSS